jgi:inosine-uridine nucleoside N-ribohydrolase
MVNVSQTNLPGCLATRGRRYLLLGLLALGFVAAAGAEGTRRRVIIDEDVGAASDSNLQAIAMLLQQPDVEVIGITVVAGDGAMGPGVGHVRRLLASIGRTDVPVLPGATAPLVNTREDLAEWEKKFGRRGWKGVWNETAPAMNASPVETPPADPSGETAAAFLVRETRLHPGEISLIAGGPLTNVALACALDPGFAGRVRGLYLCSGNFDRAAQTVSVGFNLYFDPEAARVVFRARWRDLTVASPDSRLDEAITPGMEKAVAAAGTRLTRHLLLSPNPDRKYAMWDEILVALWIDPRLAVESVDRFVDVDLDRGAGYGRLINWTPGQQPALGEPRARIVIGIDRPRFEQLFLQLIAAGP